MRGHTPLPLGGALLVLIDVKPAGKTFRNKQYKIIRRRSARALFLPNHCISNSRLLLQ